MTLDDAIVQACNSVGIVPPRAKQAGKWHRTDTEGKNGKGDGSVIFDEDRVTAYNWQTGDNTTVWLKNEFTIEERRKIARRRADDDRKERERAAKAAELACAILSASRMGAHQYLAAKGFAGEKAPIIGADNVRSIAGSYLVPAGGQEAIIVPARGGNGISSLQLIWESGEKKFLFGGSMAGAAHRIASGRATWLCEGYATALSIRTALSGLSRRDGVVVCFSASNIVKVARLIEGPCYIAADHDAPPKAKPDQFGGIGAGEYFAMQAGKPYAMPPQLGDDFNDMHQSDGIFAVQRVLAKLIREARP